MKLYIARKPKHPTCTVFTVVAKGKEEFRRAFERLKELAGPNGKAADLIGKKTN